MQKVTPTVSTTQTERTQQTTLGFQSQKETNVSSEVKKHADNGASVKKSTHCPYFLVRKLPPSTESSKAEAYGWEIGIHKPDKSRMVI